MSHRPVSALLSARSTCRSPTAWSPTATTWSANGVPLDEPQNLVVSADVGLMPGLVLAGDVGYFDNDASGTLPGSLDDDGYQAVARLGLAF